MSNKEIIRKLRKKYIFDIKDDRIIEALIKWQKKNKTVSESLSYGTKNV